MAFQTAVLFLFEFEKLVSFDKDVVAQRHFNVRYNFEAF